MEIELYTVTTERNRIRKNLGTGIVVNGYLRSESGIMKPVFELELENATTYNYVYISDFNRYYFIDNVVSVRTNIWRVECSCDVLMSYAEQILQCDVIAANSESDSETYMSGSAWQVTKQNVTDIINFPQGFNDTGEFILITAGGNVANDS